MHHDHRNLKIVVADADRAVLELVQVRLDLKGFHTCIARSGEGVLELLQNVRPAAVILDLKLPDMSGFDLLEILAQRGGPSYPILVMGKSLAIEDVKRALSLGARDCMAKPFSGADILDRVARLLKAPSGPAQRAAPRDDVVLVG